MRRLGELLGAAVQQADVRIGALDDFAVEFEHQAEHAVRGRMLGTEVDGVVRISAMADVPYFSSRTIRGYSRAARCSPADRHGGPASGRSASRHSPETGKSLRNGWPTKP